MDFVPNSFELALGMLIISMIGWGSWANTLKKCGNWRFEAWYVFYIIGIFFTILLLDMILSVNETSFLEGLFVSSTNHIVYATLSGVLWNLGTLLLVIAITLAGFAFAFPVGIGISIILGTLISYFVNPSGQAILLFAGVGFLILGIAANSSAYFLKDKNKGEFTSRLKLKKGIVLSILTGIILSAFPFFLSLSLTPKGTLDSYAATFFFSIGALISVIPFVYLISKLRITGEEKIHLNDFTHAKTSWYLWGLFAGVIWGIGTIFNFTAAVVTGVAIAFSFGNGAILVAAIWGIFVWKELKDAPKLSWVLITLMFLSFIAGLISLAFSFK